MLGIEILDECDKVEDMQQLARQMWVKRAAGMGIRIETLPKAQNTDFTQS